MLEFINAIPIGRKIIGLVAVLLAAMLVIAVINEIAAERQQAAVGDLTEDLLPMSRSLTTIDM